MAHPMTDIVISLHATRQYPAETYFAHCIETLRATTENYRLILVDDACDDIGRAAVEKAAAETGSYLIRTPKQKWYTRAFNRGLRLVRTPWVVLLNADTELGSGWLDELYAVHDEFIERNPGRRVGIVGSVLSGEEPRRWAESVQPDYVTAHCWLAQMSALYDISAMRGQPGWYLNELRQDCIHIRSDVHGSWECNQAGWATIKSFKSAVGHHGFKSWGADVGKVAGLRLADVDD